MSKVITKDMHETPHACLPSMHESATPPTRAIGGRLGLTTSYSSTHLRRGARRIALSLAHRFRVIRTVDVAAACYPERPFKTALSAAQRVMRGLVKERLLARYRTDRFQTVYGLTARGAEWLQELGQVGAASVRRVSDMSNPEHRLWSQFLVACCEVRGLEGQTESELLARLAKAHGEAANGLLNVTLATTPPRRIQLRPDAIAIESDGLTWFEVDRSKRGALREASLLSLAGSLGRTLTDGNVLRRVVVHCRSERIEKRAFAILSKLTGSGCGFLVPGQRVLRPIGNGTFEAWLCRENQLPDGRLDARDELVGHIVVQQLPIWLPKVRVDSRNVHSMAGWFNENYLPYRRPGSLGAWRPATSPLSAKALPGGRPDAQ